jgi:hypothetical protein
MALHLRFSTPTVQERHSIYFTTGFHYSGRNQMIQLHLGKWFGLSISERRDTDHDRPSGQEPEERLGLSKNERIPEERNLSLENGCGKVLAGPRCDKNADSGFQLFWVPTRTLLGAQGGGAETSHYALVLAKTLGAQNGKSPYITPFQSGHIKSTGKKRRSPPDRKSITQRLECSIRCPSTCPYRDTKQVNCLDQAASEMESWNSSGKDLESNVVCSTTSLVHVAGLVRASPALHSLRGIIEFIIRGEMTFRLSITDMLFRLLTEFIYMLRTAVDPPIRDDLKWLLPALVSYNLFKPGVHI